MRQDRQIRNARVLLRRNGGEETARVVSQLASLGMRAEKAAELLGLEGVAARLCFGAFPHCCAGQVNCQGPAFAGLRNRRPPPMR